MSSKYNDLRYALNEIVAELPEKYFTTYEVGYVNDPSSDKYYYGVYEKGTNGSVCQTGASQALAYLITELLNNIDLVDSALSLVGKLDEKFDLQIETEGESLPLYDQSK